MWKFPNFILFYNNLKLSHFLEHHHQQLYWKNLQIRGTYFTEQITHFQISSFKSTEFRMFLCASMNISNIWTRNFFFFNFVQKTQYTNLQAKNLIANFSFGNFSSQKNFLFCLRFFFQIAFGAAGISIIFFVHF